MELDLSQYRWFLIGLAAILLLAGLGWLGYTFTPGEDQLLTWSEWQVAKAQRAYQDELGRLQEAVDSLAALLETQSGGLYRPDPVRAQLVAERIQRLTREGQPALQYPREKLALAAQAVSDWAVGASEYEVARLAVEEAIQALSPQPVFTPTPASMSDPVQSSMGTVLFPLFVRC